VGMNYRLFAAVVWDLLVDDGVGVSVETMGGLGRVIKHDCAIKVTSVIFFSDMRFHLGCASYTALRYYTDPESIACKALPPLKHS
jgi:hypothetical protein